MATDLQIAANRANARKSTGPSTPEGKHAAAANALRHGLDARSFRLSREDAPAYQILRDALHAEWDPQGPTETLLLERLIAAQWRLLRIDRIEAGYFEFCWFRSEPSDELPSPDAEDAFIYTEGVDDGILPKLSEAYARAERSFNRALRQLRQARRRSPQAPTPIPAKLASFCEKNLDAEPGPVSVTPLPHSDGSHNQNEPRAA